MNEREYVFNALLLVDKVITEDNGKRCFIGSFNKFNFKQFPAASPPWTLYASLSNVVGEHNVVFNLVHDETEAVALSVGGELNAPNITADVDIIIPIGNVRFLKKGKYILTMKIDGNHVASRSVMVNLLPEE